MGICYSIEVDSIPEPSPVIVYELEVHQVYNYNMEDPEEPTCILNTIKYIKNCPEPTENIYEDNF
jgi:hypothetical protein